MTLLVVEFKALLVVDFKAENHAQIYMSILSHNLGQLVPKKLGGTNIQLVNET